MQALVRWIKRVRGRSSSRKTAQQPTATKEEEETTTTALKTAIATPGPHIVVASSAEVLHVLMESRDQSSILLLDGIEKRANETEMQWLMRRMRLPCWIGDDGRPFDYGEAVRSQNISTLVLFNADFLPHPNEFVGIAPTVVFVIAEFARVASFACSMMLTSNEEAAARS
jgi:hypothetical protein